MNYIELFAGCGGLSLGLKSTGFNLVLANELSPMAAESYAFNFFKEDLQTQATSTAPKIKNTLWLSSKYTKSNLKSRLREDPRSYPALGEGYSDISQDGKNMVGSLIVGSIVDLNRWLEKNPEATQQLRKGLSNRGVDLVSGGPPCQSFSMAGLRRKDCEKNTLPWEFAKFAQTIQPKIVLLENVTGILRPFKDELGTSYYAWFELAKAFAEIGYIPLCLHVNAKLAGVPQNRPRFILLGVRKSFFDEIRASFNEAEIELFQQPLEFFIRSQSNKDISIDNLHYREVSKQHDIKLFENSFLAPIISHRENIVTVEQAIDDLRKPDSHPSIFSRELSSTFKNILPPRKIENHEHRTNNNLVKRRFRIYQILQQLEKTTQKRILSLLKGEDTEISDTEWNEIKKFNFLMESGESTSFKNKADFYLFLAKHTTKKQTQKALLAGQPAPAALSIPDDACHYHQEELRTLTVREMARIQSFPDNFQFRSKITTGGKMRQFEVPQYTQVGNAVPPLLGRALGLAISDLLHRKK